MDPSPPPLPPPLEPASAPEPFAFPGLLPSSLPTSNILKERVPPPPLSPTRATIEQVEEIAALAPVEIEGGERDTAEGMEKVEEDSTSEEQVEELPGSSVDLSAVCIPPPVINADSTTEKDEPTPSPAVTSSLPSYGDDPPISSLPTLPSQGIPSSPFPSLPPARQPHRSSPTPDDGASDSSPAPTARFSPSSTEPATLPSPTPTPTQMHHLSSCYRPTQTDDSPDPLRILPLDAFLPSSQTSTATQKGKSRSRSCSLDPSLREAAERTRAVSPSRSAPAGAGGEAKVFRKPKASKELAAARAKALTGVEEEAPSSSLPALTPTQLPPPSSSLPLLTQTQFDPCVLEPLSSSLPPLTQTQRAPTTKILRKVVKPSIVESSQVSGDAAFEMEVDSSAPPPAKPAREFNFEVLIESSGDSDSARRRTSTDSRPAASNSQKPPSSPLSPLPTSDPASQPKRLRKTSTAPSPPRGRQDAPESSSDLASPAKKARRKKVVEQSESEEVYKPSPKKRGKKGKEVNYAESEGEEAREESPKKKVRVGKGKGNTVEKRVESKEKVVVRPIPETSSIASSSFVLSQALSDAPLTETDEDRAKGWALGKMDQLVWVRAGVEGSEFWWPADIVSTLRSTRPLEIHLLVDPNGTILNFASREIKLDDPTSLSIVSFRSSAHAGRLRFNDRTFASGSISPPTTLLDDIVRQALELEAIRDIRSDDEDYPPPPSQPTARQRSPPAPAPAIELDDDELTREGNGERISFPINVIAKAVGRWWAARLTGPATGPRSAGKFAVEWVDGTTGTVSRKDYLVPADKPFFTVLLGETELSVNAGYASDLVSFVAKLEPTLQLIINDEFLPAKDWNDRFFAGGAKRETLAKMSRYGELLDDHIDILRTQLSAWAQGPHDTPRPTGSSAYEALDDRLRSRFIADVLLPLTAMLVLIEENAFEDAAREELGIDIEAGLAKDDAVWPRAFELAHNKLDLGSLQKWVKAARMAKATADSNPEGMEKMRRRMRA